VVRAWAAALALALCVVSLSIVAEHSSTADAASPAPPLPNSIAAIGDSITQAFDDCCSFGVHPQDSWSTGNGWPANEILSHYQRILLLNGSISGHEFNDAVSGAKVADTNAQAQMAVAQSAQYVTILIGANDVCTPTIATMTTTAAFQTAFQATMSTLESGLPAGAHIFVSSIPNIYQLWSVLHGNPTAEAVWALGICQSMLARSNTEAQRQQVLSQEEADNAVLGQVCTQYANCRWDGDGTFNQAITPDQVSTIDYFHPSRAGQSSLAAETWANSWWPGVGGYWLAASDGGVLPFGVTTSHGSMAGMNLNAPVAGLGATPQGGYWLAASDGGVFSFGAPFFGSMGGQHLNAPVVSIASTRDGAGYYLVAADGGVFTFGDAHFHGSMAGTHLNAPVVGIAVSPDNQGYYLVAADGGVFTFGDAHFQGSMGATHLNAPVVGMAVDSATSGYWLVAGDGGLFTFGAPFFGSTGNIRLAAPVVGMAALGDGLGYRFVASDGGVFCFGAAQFLGSVAGYTSAAMVGIASPD
jgi:lysophospholipase L1-like esterase